MTIDEAIKHCEIIAENNDIMAEDLAGNDENGIYINQVAKYRKYADEYHQLAEWLRELKEYQSQNQENKSLYN